MSLGQDLAPRRAVDLVTEDAILIDRSPAEVWPLIADESAWKKTVKLVHVSGPAQQVGEVFAASVPASGPDTLYYIETVDLETNRRRTLKLFNAAKGPLIGYASWELEVAGRGTRVTFRVFAELPASEADLPRERMRSTADNQRRFRAELLELKRLAESPARGKTP
jgi:hypothetical protein